MLDPTALDGLRRAATLAAHLPLGLRLHGRAGPVVEVARPPGPDAGDLVVVPPCGFRLAVGKAWEAHQRGCALGLKGFAVDDQPHVEVVLPPGGWTDALVVHHVPTRAGVVHAFATTAPLERCRAVADDLGLSVRHDEATGATLLAAADDDVLPTVELITDAVALLLPDEAALTVARWS